jgi:hypothetical protein
VTGYGSSSVTSASSTSPRMQASMAGVELLQPPGGDIWERQFAESRVYGAAYVAAVGVERAFVALVCV